MNTTYGYVRVSSTDQHTDRQHLALQERGIPRERVFTDRLSGKDGSRKLLCQQAVGQQQVVLLGKDIHRKGMV